MNRLALLAISALLLSGGAAASKAAAQSAATPSDTPTREGMRVPPAGGDKPAPGAAQPSGAQVLPLPAPDASTASGQERGNAALKAGQNPSASGTGATVPGK